jgi:1-acyl-sn-glycerol-3-phosphate acyltransferase
MTARTPDDLEPFQDPLEPYTLGQTLLNLVLWPASLAHMAGWLTVFTVLDKTVARGSRFNGLARFVSRRVTDLLGIRVQAHGLHHLQPDQSYVFCPNHVSLLDTPVLVQSIPVFSRSFQDVSHFKIPIYGGFVRVMGQLPVSRKDKELNRQSFAQAKEMLHAGDSFVVLAEGHRTRDGRLGKFYPGAFRLAIDAQRAIVPVVSRGLRNLCPADDWRIRPGKVDVIFGKPIETRGMAEPDVPALSDRVRSAMNRLLWQGSPPA